MNNAVYDDLIKKATSKGKEGGLDNIINYIDDYLIKNPNTFEAYIVRSEFFTAIEAFDDAIDDAETAIKINPNEAVAYHNRGLAYANIDKPEKALDDFSKAIILEPNYSAAYINRANVYLKMRELKKAIDDCTKAIQISPENEEAYFNRGLAYANIDEPEKALDDYNNVIRLAPDNTEAYFKRGLLHSHLGNIQEGISDYEKFLKLDPQNKNAKPVRDELEKLKSGVADDSYEISIAKKQIKTNDEKFCFSCGEVIKKEAEICPKCGVNQLKRNNTSALEVYCFSCGKKIKREAEICPKCGVRQIGTSSGTGQMIAQNGNEIRINKHLFVWVFSFLLGWFGVDRFMRGQIVIGIAKLFLDWFGIWALIDWSIALTKYGVQGEEFVFVGGKWKE